MPKLEEKAENASASLIAVNPRLALRMDQLHIAQVPAATDALASSTSIVSNLEGFMTIADLLPDVRILDSHSQFDLLIDILILRLVISI